MTLQRAVITSEGGAGGFREVKLFKHTMAAALQPYVFMKCVWRQ